MILHLAARDLMRAQQKTLVAVALACALIIGLLLVPIPDRWHGPWQSKCFDLAHVPLFAALTLFLSRALHRSWKWPVVISLTLAGLAEVAQAFTGRTADFWDFVRGAAGVGIALTLMHACTGPRPGRWWAVHPLIALALFAWPLFDAGPYLLDAYQGWQAFPTLADFSTARQMLRWQAQQAVLTRLPDEAVPGTWQGRIDFLPGREEYPGIILQPILRDFSGRRKVCWLFSTDDKTLTLVFSVRSGQDKVSPSNHFQFARSLAAGVHRVEADLRDIAPKAGPGPLDLSNIIYLQIFVVRPESGRTIYLKRVWLE